MIIEKIIQAQSGNRDDMLWLIDKFEPLLRGYAQRLRYEDAYADLVVFFIEFVQTTIKLHTFDCVCDGKIVRYIEKAFYYEFLARLRKISIYNDYNVLLSGLSDAQKAKLEMQSATHDVYNEFDINSLRKILTEAQLDIINLFLAGYSVAEIAEQKHISRQSVNQTKLDIRKRLKNNGLLL